MAAAFQHKMGSGLFYFIFLVYVFSAGVDAARCLDYLVTCPDGWNLCARYIDCDHGCCGDSVFDQYCCPDPNNDDDSSTNSVWMVAAAILGGILVVSLIACGVALCIKQKNKHRTQVYNNTRRGTTEFTGINMNTAYVVPTAPPRYSAIQTPRPPSYTRTGAPQPTRNTTVQPARGSEPNANTNGPSSSGTAPGPSADRNAPNSPGPPRYSRLGIQSPPPAYSPDGSAMP